MTVEIRRRDKPAPLSVRVTLAEQRVLNRRQRVRTRIALLGRTLRSQLSSPAALLWAGGLGFAAAEFTRRPIRPPANAERRPSAKAERPRAPPVTLIDRVLKLMTFVRMLSSVFPAADAHPEHPGPSG